MTKPFYTDKHTCEICLMQCRAEERHKIEKELGCSIEEAKITCEKKMRYVFSSNGQLIGKAYEEE